MRAFRSFLAALLALATIAAPVAALSPGQRAAVLSLKPVVASPVYEHIPTWGQSEGLGTAAGVGTVNAITTSPATSGAFMFANGFNSPRAHIDTVATSVDRSLDVSQITGIAPLREATRSNFGNYGETHLSGFAAQYLKNGGNKLLVDTCARGSAAWLDIPSSAGVYISPGSYHFANCQTLQILGRKYVTAAGGVYRRGPLINLHGQADASTLTTTTYPQMLAYEPAKIALYNALDRSLAANPTPQRMYTMQLSETAAGPRFFDIARAQSDSCVLNALIVCVGPAYPYAYDTDNLHHTAAAYRTIGAQIGKWARRVEKEGWTVKGFYPTGATLVSSAPYVVRITFSVPVPPLVKDETSVASCTGSAGTGGGCTNYGVTYAADSGTLTITSVAITAGASPTSIDVTMSGDPSAVTNPRWKFGELSTLTNAAGPTNGARTNWRDSDPEKSVPDGADLYNWLNHSQIGLSP